MLDAFVKYSDLGLAVYFLMLLLYVAVFGRPDAPPLATLVMVIMLAYWTWKLRREVLKLQAER